MNRNLCVGNRTIAFAEEMTRFPDAWAGLRPGTAGYTCCHTSDLSKRFERLEERLDYMIGQIARVSEVSAHRINGSDSSIWPFLASGPSDHAGLVVGLRIPPAGERQP